MAYLQEGYYSDRPAAANALPAERVAFIQKTYAHVAGAILLFAALEAILLSIPGIETVIGRMFGSTMSMIVLLIAFIGGGYLAQSWAHSSTSRSTQYAGLLLYVLIQVVIFLPLLYIADNYFKGQALIAKAGLVTLGLTAGLSMAVFLTGKDFSFIGPVLCILSWVALMTLIAGWIFGFSLGLWFSGAMIALASGFILYDTSRILHHYTTDHYVGAALELFASIALLFYYVLRLAMQLASSRD